MIDMWFHCLATACEPNRCRKQAKCQNKRQNKYLRQNPEFEVEVAESLVVDSVNTYALEGEVVG